MAKKMLHWTDDIPERARVVACLGFFDGVHLGHQELFRVARGRAEACGGVTVVVTFEPHPATLVSRGLAGSGDRVGAPPDLLTPLEEKARLIESFGVDYLRVIPFTPDLMKTEPREFARIFLVEQLKARVVVVGFNFTFGFRASGKAQDLVEFGKELGFEAVIVPPVMRRGEVVSSTAIRRALVEGDVEKAGELLGRAYSVEGIVGRGEGRGRLLGFPTANLDVHPQKLLPAPGVYACRVYPGALEERVHREATLADSGTEPAFAGRAAVANVGTCPTFGERRLHLEVHIPAWSGNLYGQQLRVEFLRRLRDEKKFASVEELRDQVARDVLHVIESQR
ncbi:MAG: bifunctional riboflavin kinase/FAD synthetase [Firmicutes bacterium]|nr:bifunctional riboflavin kinase/FAD synthetase [Candidatus Fermentithermobacillaceae bacterium]